jgi:outer membrane receptor for ferrienterochelin and colicins
LDLPRILPKKLDSYEWKSLFVNSGIYVALVKFRKNHKKMGNSISLLNNDVVLTTKEAMEYLKEFKPKFIKYIRSGRIRDTKSGTALRVHRSELNFSNQRYLSIKNFSTNSLDSRAKEGKLHTRNLKSFTNYLTGIRAGSFVLLLTFLLTAGWIEASSSINNLPPDLTELSLEELMEVEIPTVYSASKYEQKVTQAPSSVSIVTAEEIKKYGYRTLADILRSIRSFYISYDRNYSYVGVRGFSPPGDYNSRILLLIDGHRINEDVYDSISMGTDFILDVDLIERVEVVRGPSSSLYGGNAFFAVINIITKQGQNFKGPEVSGEAGSFYTYRNRLTYGNRFQNGLEVLFSGSYYHSKGDQHLFFKEFDDPTTNDGVAENCDGDQFYSLFSNVSFKDFNLQGAYVSRDKTIPTGSYGADFNDPHNRTIDAQGYLDLKYEHSFDDQLDVVARLFYDDYYCRGDYIYSSVLNKDLAWGKRWGGELKFFKMLLRNHKVTLGGKFNDNFRQDQRNYDVAPYLLYLDEKDDSGNWGVYIQDEFSILKNLILNGGFRHDQYSTFGGTNNPRMALIYNPFEKTIFKLLYGTAFRPPNVYELYYNDSGWTAKSNPDLEPETIRTYEIVYEQYLGKRFSATTSLFTYKIKDLISQILDPSDSLLVFHNIEEVKAKGIEFELDGKWPNGLEGRVSYSFTKTKDLETGEVLTNSPKHLAKFNLIFPLMRDKIFLGMEEQFTGNRKTLAGKKADAFFITNLNLFSQNLIKDLEIFASVYNLFNRKYSDPGGAEHLQNLLKQDGQVFRFKLTYRF